MNKISLKSSGNSFFAFDPPQKHYVDFHDLLKNKDYFRDKVNENGFLIIKNALNKKELNNLRDNYYKRFPNDFVFSEDNWFQINNPKGSHGYGNHPVKNYVKSKEFLKFVYSKRLNDIASILLGSKDTVISKRIIVRSFANSSTVTTKAHKDSDYYVSSDLSKAVTAWIPIGPADKDHGQLIYLENSHKFSYKDNSKLDKKDRVITSNLEKLGSESSSRWLIPKLNMGDILFHCLRIVHASFDSTVNIPRLSCDIRFAASSEFQDPRWNSYFYGEDGL